MDWIAYILILVLFIIMCTGFVYLNKKITKPIIINHIAGTSEIYTEDEQQQEIASIPPPPPPSLSLSSSPQTSFEQRKSPERAADTTQLETKNKTTSLESTIGTTPLESAKGTTPLQF